jgi:putative transposase
MKGKRYPEEQIIGIIREVEAGSTIAEVCRKYGVSEWSVYRWRNKYRGMDVSEAKRLRALEEENARLKRIVAQQAMDIDALKQVLSKKW